MRHLILFLCLLSPVRGDEVREEAVEHAGVRFRVVRVEAARLRLVWKGPTGQPYRTFDRVQRHFREEGKAIRFLMNAGIFEPGGTPSGLHVEDGRILHGLNPGPGEGNFFLKPGGVFSWQPGAVKEGDATITTTEARAALDRQAGSRSGAPLMEVQSGPMLLIDGNRHPAFREGSPNKLTRNGVGVDSKGRIVFAITAPGQEVNFWDFAGLFLKLDCRNALFLDGDISRMEVNPSKPLESQPFGAMFVIAE